MNHCLITFRSITPAQRAEGLLRRSGINCAIRRTPRWMEEQGCGYSIRLPLEDAESAMSILQANRLAYRKVYVQQENGGVEELRL